MSTYDNSQSSQPNFKKKGLGWSPDYPDLRDYTLENDQIQVNGRLKRSDLTEATENLTSTLLKTLIAFRDSGDQSNECNEKINFLDQRIEDLESQIFGNIYFVPMKAHKMLREEVKKLDVPAVVREVTQEQSFKQIAELKQYLALLVLKGKLKPLEFSENELEELKRKNQHRRETKESQIITKADFEGEGLESLVKWLRSPEFDEVTKQLVMLFQCHANLLVDGVVGFQTYTALNDCFLNSTILGSEPKYEDCQEYCKNLLLGKPLTQDSNKYQNSNIFKLTAIPLIIPETVFEAIFEIAKKISVDQIIKELSSDGGIEKVKQALFEKEFLKKVKEKNPGEYSNFNEELFEKLFTGCFQEADLEKVVSSKQQNLESYIHNLLNDALNAHELTETKGFSALFNQEFYVIEPIVSVLLKHRVPLAKFNNKLLEEIIVERLLNLKNLIQSAKSELSDIQILKQEDPGALARAALHAVFYSFCIGIQLIVSEKSCPESKNKILFFYFLLKKLLNSFSDWDLDSQVEAAVGRKANIFNKQELLEFDPSSVSTIDSSSDSSSSNQHSSSLFSTLTLQVPFSQSLLKLLMKNCIKSNGSQANNGVQKVKNYLYLPGVVDLSYWCSEIEDQGALNACTAFAGVALVEYFANRSLGQHTDLSPLFLYKVARTLMNVEGDVGSSIRETMKAMALFGVPPEESWPYIEGNVGEEPPPFCYSYAQNYQALKYFRLDYAGMAREELLLQIKVMLAGGFPCMFGFTVYTSMYEGTNPTKGYIPFPDLQKDRVVGGHALVAVGYDDYKVIRCADRKTYSTGAFIVRNSWGVDWGRDGYGWLPYDYVLTGLTGAWWSLLKSEWFNGDNFGLGGEGGEGTPRG
ncbi:MAG: C1 family peptidase [Leptolyngbyaceae cyanobacterium bins.349]|nr:C1 family peptidase [Leptolyngbyaceae cyanobacterium bins.349]